jgi:hypothetical protein
MSVLMIPFHGSAAKVVVRMAPATATQESPYKVRGNWGAGQVVSTARCWRAGSSLTGTNSALWQRYTSSVASDGPAPLLVLSRIRRNTSP